MKTLIPFLIILRLLIASAFAASLPAVVPLSINRTNGQLTTTNFFKQNSNELNAVVAPTAAAIKDATSAGRALMTATDHASQRGLMKVSAVFNTLSEALASSELVAGQIVRVYAYNSNVPYASARDFVVTNGVPSAGTNWWGNYPAASGGLYLMANEGFKGRHHASWWGFNGDGSTDNSGPFQRYVAYTLTHTIALEFDAGWYLTTYAPKFTGNHPINMFSMSGSFETGWNPTNDMTVAKFIYTGPATNIFFDFAPSTGIRYGMMARGITFDANGLAGSAVNFYRVTRADFTACRFRNSTNQVLVLNNSQYNYFKQCTISSAELPFLIAPRTGLYLTNQANGNVFENFVVNGCTEYGVEYTGNSKLNRMSESGVEGNTGGGIMVRATANENEFSRIWMEQNGDTNNYVATEANSLHSHFSHIYFEDHLGDFNIDGSHSLFENIVAARLFFNTNAGRNTVENMLLGMSNRPAGVGVRFQTLRNVADATATINTNTMPDSLAIYNGVLDILSGTLQYPSVRLTASSVMFGNGTSGYPAVGWMRASDLSLLSSNTLLLKALSANSGVLSVSVTNESYARFALLASGKISIGDGATTADVNLTRIGASTLSIDSSLISIISGTNSTVLSAWLAGSGATQPNFRIQEDGRIEIGPGGSTAADVKFYRESAGVLRVNDALSINGTNVLTVLNQLLANSNPTNYVDLSVGTLTVTNPIGISVGGTAASNAAQARVNLGVVGTNAIMDQLLVANAASLTNLNGTEIRSGTVADARIDAAIARLSGPTFTSDPKAPTASPGDNDTSIATTAFVTAAVAAGGGGGGGGGSTTNLKVNGAWVTNANLTATVAPTRGQVVQWNTSTADVIGWVDQSQQIPLVLWYQPSSSFMLWTTTNGNPIAWGNDSNSWSLRYSGFVPRELYAMPAQLTVVSWWKLYAGNSASQTIVVGAKVMRALGGDDADSFGTQTLVTNTVTAAGTWFAITNVITSLDSLGVGEPFTLDIENTAASASATFTNNIAFRGAELRYQ